MEVVIRRVGEGEPIVFLHGFLGDGEDFRDVAEGLPEGWQRVFVDLPGHGESGFSRENWEEAPGTGIEKMGRALEARLARDGVKGGHLVGYSMGARVALWLSLRGGLAWRSLTVVSGSPGISEPEERRARREVDGARAQAIRSEGLRVFLEGWYQMEIFAGLEETEGFAETLRRRARGDGAVMAYLIEEMSPGRQEDLWPWLGELTLPTLWVAGSRDKKYVEMLRRASALAPGGELAVLRGAGHAAHLEASEEFSRCLSRFLAAER